MNAEDLRALVETDLSEAALTSLLNAATEFIEERLGPVGPLTETRRPHGPLIGLSRRAVEILEIVDERVVVDSAEYRLRPSGLMVERVRGRWRGRVDVRYQPRPDIGRRESATGELVKLHLDSHPGVTSFRFGSFAESYAQGDGTYAQKVDAILCAIEGEEGFLH